MNSERDTMGIVRSWLRDDGYDNGDRVLDAVLAGIDSVPQRHSRPMGLRWPSLNARTLRYAVAAASIVAAAIFGLDWLSRSVANPPTPGPTATPSASLLVRLPEEDLHGGRYGLALALGISVEVPRSPPLSRCRRLIIAAPSRTCSTTVASRACWSSLTASSSASWVLPRMAANRLLKW